MPSSLHWDPQAVKITCDFESKKPTGQKVVAETSPGNPARDHSLSLAPVPQAVLRKEGSSEVAQKALQQESGLWG